MIFGNPQNFAIEVHHEPSDARWAGYGRMALHLGGETVGDLSERHCSLFDATACLERAATHFDSLWDPAFEGRTPDEVFRVIDGAIYGENGDDDRFLRFDLLTNSGEMFDDWKIFLVRWPEGHAGVIWRAGAPLGSAGVRFVSCEGPIFCQTVGAFARWFRHAVAHPAPPWFPVE